LHFIINITEISSKALNTSELAVNLKNIPIKLESSNKKPIYIATDKGYYSKKNFDIIETDYHCRLWRLDSKCLWHF
jgi:hypothetical protein